jgi:hypothetical protein
MNISGTERMFELRPSAAPPPRAGGDHAPRGANSRGATAGFANAVRALRQGIQSFEELFIHAAEPMADLVSDLLDRVISVP